MYKILCLHVPLSFSFDYVTYLINSLWIGIIFHTHDLYQVVDIDRFDVGLIPDLAAQRNMNTLLNLAILVDMIFYYTNITMIQLINSRSRYLAG
jgi:hypothetical protein